MSVRRNDPCPCGSGLKFKKCCIDDDKYISTKLNNGLTRKYMSEFALHTFSSTVVICYPNLLGKVDVSNKSYHIYMVHQIPRLSFVEGSLKFYESYVEVKIQQGVFENVTHQTVRFSIIDGNHKAVFNSYEIIKNKTLIIRDNEGGGLEIDILTLYTNYSDQPLDAEILYVGQSYGKAGERGAKDRLVSHSTLQAILAETMHNIELEIVITLWEFTPRLITSYDGISKNYLTSDKEDLEHLTKVLSAPPLRIDKSIINITEAAMINYFKPIYNDKFKNNFPDITHKTYTFYYDYDYNAVMVELDNSCININIYAGEIRYSQLRTPIKYHLNSEEDRRSMFDINFSRTLI